jgi:uroporphyrinogen decarboxylase
MNLTHRERLHACLANDSALDRPPVALWRHFPVDDQVPETLASATLDFQRRYDFDLVKVTPASSFCLIDWGAEDAWEGNPEGTRRYIKRVIEKPQDWEQLPILDPHQALHLAGQLACLRLIKRELDPETPLLQTVFNPLAQAKNLVGGSKLIVHLRQHPEAVLKGLQTIAETTRRFVEACLEIGIDGIFFANQHAQSGLLTLEEYKEFGLPYDLDILEPAKALWCNLLHLHGDHIYFQLAQQTPCHIVNWHDRETGPTLAEAQKSFRGTVCGGLSVDRMVFGDQSEVRKDAEDAILQTNGKKFILGTGCVTPIIAPHGNIMAARQSVEGPG